MKMDAAAFKRSRLVHLCLGITFFISGLIVNVIQCVLYFGLKPFNKRLYRQIGYYLCYTIFSQLTLLSTWWTDTTMFVTADEETMKHLGKEHCLLLVNHAYEIDWLMGWTIAEKVGVLGNCKSLVKKALLYVPIIGWSWKFAEFCFLERSYEKDKHNIIRQINAIYDYPSPTWIAMTAEGTRFTPTKHIASQKFAAERGLPVLKHHLIPRTKGFTACVGPLKAKCPAIYDLCVAFKKDDKVQPTISNLVFGRGVTAHLNIRRIPTTELPADEEKAAEWLQNLFKEKDVIMEQFFQTGSFSDTIKPVHIARRLTPLLNTIAWCVATLIPLAYCLTSFLLNGQFLYLSIATGLIFSLYILMQKTMGMSEISKSSSYGSEADANKKIK